MKLSRRIIMMAGGIFLILFIFSGYWLLVGRKTAMNNKNEQVVTSEDVVPTVDSSVKVSLTPLSGRKEVILSTKNIPRDISSLQYILSYETEEGGVQGVNSTAEIVGSDFEKKITLGTCSSGTCIYHNIKDKITVELLFKGENGDRSFIKEYNI